MIPVLSRAEMRAFDKRAIETCHVPGLVLMENAGRGAAEVILRGLGADERHDVVVVCGSGNNGGDGFVVARHLAAAGVRDVTVFLTKPGPELTGDGRTNYEALRACASVSLVDLGSNVGPLKSALGRASVVVDALFGTGLDRPIGPPLASVIEAINEAACPCIAIDVPSGLNADTGASMGATVRADVTVTFAHPKLGLLTPNGARMAGRVEVVGLGVPTSIGEPVGSSAALLEREDVARALVPRARSLHKAGAGHVVVFAGSPGKVGASLLSARAALRAGAGLVTLATWPEAAAAIEGRVPEVMTERVDKGSVAESVDAILEGKRAVVLGPGFGTGDDARSVVEHVLRTWEGPSVVDADALSMFEGSPEVFASSKGAPVLTPHPGELGRLIGSTAKDVESDRFGAIASLVSRARCVVVLKGAHTLIAAPDEKVVVNPTGNAALATAGAGDVLSGILGALTCTLDPFEAAYVGVYVHGLAADVWRDAHGDRGLLAGEIADEVPALLAAFAKTHARWPD